MVTSQGAVGLGGNVGFHPSHSPGGGQGIVGNPEERQTNEVGGLGMGDDVVVHESFEGYIGTKSFESVVEAADMSGRIGGHSGESCASVEARRGGGGDGGGVSREEVEGVTLVAGDARRVLIIGAGQGGEVGGSGGDKGGNVG